MRNKQFSIMLRIIVLLTFASIANAKDYILLIGGGPSLEESQSSIELNVLWSEEIIRRKNPDAKVRIFYSDGDDPEPDVVNNLEMKDPDAGILPFDRLFNREAHVKEYYNHSIKDHSGSTDPDHMIPILVEDLKNLTNKDSVLILYNGHGGYNSADLSGNYLRLWGEKKFTVYDFESLLSNVDDEVQVRFILTQCFSGGFTNAIHSKASKETLELKGNRCGFMAQSARRESEGCTASLDIGDYRDYSTYFFAALDGKTRQNALLSSDPDFNGDDEVSLHEAHLYTLMTAYSSDLSRSTSEDYLEKWEPWYLRWISAKSQQKNSIYYELAIRVASNNKIPLDVLNYPAELRKVRSDVYVKHQVLLKRDNELKNKMKDNQALILAELAVDYPDIKQAYKTRFADYADEKLEQAKNAIINSSKYIELKELFTARSEIVEPLIDANRELAQIEKIFRLLKLSKLESLIPVLADDESYTAYKKLLSCENTNL